SPDLDVFDAIDQILARHISGAPVLDRDGRYLGIFSEKTAMQVLISAAYDQLPGTRLDAYMNTDPRRVIEDQATLIDIAQKFQQTHYRRLPVVIDGKLIGQVSRRDVIRSQHAVVQQVSMDPARAKSGRLGFTNGSAPVERFMDREARTIAADEDLLNIAQIFLTTPYRRLPVVSGEKLLGQVSRRDLLTAAASLLWSKPECHKPELLYLSPLADTAPPSLR
ncbi:MAG: CBS domain-containing protein, partial [Planctomycetaceae bacterium]